MATGQHRAGHRGADGRAVVVGEPGHGRDGAGRIVREDGDRGQRPHRRRPDARAPGRTGAPGRRRRPGHPPPSVAIASRAATRTPGSSIASTPASAAAASGDEVLAEQRGRHPAHAGLGRAERLDEGDGDRGVAGERGEPRPALEDLLAEPGPERLEQARPVATPDADDDDRAGDRGHRAQPEDLVARQHGAGRDQQQPGEDRPDLAGNAVVEGEDLRAPLGRDDVVEGAEGRVRQAALGGLLREPEERRRWSSRRRRSRCRTRRGRPAAGPGRRRRRRTGHRRGWRPAATRRTRWRSCSRPEAQRGREVGLGRERARGGLQERDT